MDLQIIASDISVAGIIMQVLANNLKGEKKIHHEEMSNL